MARLLLINGLPGSGKSTLAARYVEHRPMSLCLDIDVVRGLLGRWQDAPTEAGRLARRTATAMARVVLLDGHDVVVPQLLAKADFIAQLERLAEECGAEFTEVVLHQEPDRALAQLEARAAGPMTPAQRDAHLLLDRDGGPEVVVPVLHQQLAALRRRRRPLVLDPVPGEVGTTFHALMALLDDPSPLA